MVYHMETPHAMPPAPNPTRAMTDGGWHRQPVAHLLARGRCGHMQVGPLAVEKKREWVWQWRQGQDGAQRYEWVEAPFGSAGQEPGPPFGWDLPVPAKVL